MFHISHGFPRSPATKRNRPLQPPTSARVVIQWKYTSSPDRYFAVVCRRRERFDVTRLTVIGNKKKVRSIPSMGCVRLPSPGVRNRCAEGVGCGWFSCVMAAKIKGQNRRRKHGTEMGKIDAHVTARAWGAGGNHGSRFRFRAKDFAARPAVDIRSLMQGLWEFLLKARFWRLDGGGRACHGL